MKRWYALYTKPKNEYKVVSHLEHLGFEAYLPTVRRKVRRRDRPERKVYFPCYLFARLDLEVLPRSAIDCLPGIRRLVSFGDQPAVVDHEIVELIRGRLDGMEWLGDEVFSPGNRVRITSGPLRDLEAVFDRPLLAEERVRVLLDVMGRLTPVELDRSQITLS